MVTGFVVEGRSTGRTLLGLTQSVATDTVRGMVSFLRSRRFTIRFVGEAADNTVSVPALSHGSRRLTADGESNPEPAELSLLCIYSLGGVPCKAGIEGP